MQFTNVTINDVFWTKRIKVNREQTLPFEYEQCKTTGRIDQFKPGFVPKGTQFTHMFNDSDVHKWLEAASYSLATHPDPKLKATVDEVVDLIVSAQQPDGYLHSFFTFVQPEMRWKNLRDNHELYTAGHLFEAAVAHFMATGERKLIDAACRFADHIDTMFGSEEGKKPGYCGHQEIELALVKLYSATGNEKYLKLSKFFIDERGKQPYYFDIEARERGEDPKDYWAKTYEYCQCHIPVREQDRVVGHAVRALYMYSGMADLAGEYGDEPLLNACNKLWDNVCLKNMYITGGIGPSAKNEGFTFDYDLPNESAYAETCASIALFLWNHRLLQLDCDSRYADVMERTIYNGIISGVSLDGRKFFYVNPLASVGDVQRQEWFACSCCPPNVARILASLGQYVYSTSDTDAVVHLYVQGTGKMNVAGQEITLTQTTEYPWDGNVRVGIDVPQPTKFGLRLRIPGWCKGATLKVNGEAVDLSGKIEKGYARIEREWKSGDSVELDLPMPVERVYSHPEVRQDMRHVALQRGPVVFCLEEADNDDSLFKVMLPKDAQLNASFQKDLLDGVVTITGEAVVVDQSGWEGQLYRTEPVKTKPYKFTAIPYFAWANRKIGKMVVWIPEA